MQTNMKAVTMPSFSITDGPRGHLQKLLQRLVRAPGTLETWRLRHLRRMQFAAVDARILRDAGISESQRFLVVNEPLWEA